MRLWSVLCVLGLTGCATGSSMRPLVSANRAGAGGSDDVSQTATEPVRMETSVGTFLVQPHNAEDFARLLAGESTQQQYYSLTDAP